MFPKEVWVIILEKLEGKDRTNMMSTCSYIYDLSLKYVWKPWENNGLFFSCERNNIYYYVKWSLVAGNQWTDNLDTRNKLIEICIRNNYVEFLKIILRTFGTKEMPNYSLCFYGGLNYISKDILEIMMNYLESSQIKHLFTTCLSYGLYDLINVFLSRQEIVRLFYGLDAKSNRENIYMCQLATPRNSYKTWKKIMDFFHMNFVCPLYPNEDEINLAIIDNKYQCIKLLANSNQLTYDHFYKATVYNKPNILRSMLKYKHMPFEIFEKCIKYAQEKNYKDIIQILAESSRVNYNSISESKKCLHSSEQ